MSPAHISRRTLLTGLAATTAVAATGVPTAAAAVNRLCGPAAKTGPISVVYIEVNDHSMLSAASTSWPTAAPRCSTSR